MFALPYLIIQSMDFYGERDYNEDVAESGKRHHTGRNRRFNDRKGEIKEQNTAPSKTMMLIVDDVEMNRAILSAIFEDQYQILEAENGLEALALIRAYSDAVAAVLLDVVMPEMDGISLLRAMKEENLGQDLPVFLITADASEKNMYLGYELGVKDIIEKPFIPYFLKQRIDGVVELYKTKAELQDTIQHQAEIIEEKVGEVRELSDSMIEALALAIEFRSGETGQHVQSIRALTAGTLKAMRERGVPGCGFTDEQIEQISLAAILHDLGKIAVPDGILNKPGRLTKEEYEIMKGHALKGAELLEKLPNRDKNPIFFYAWDICRHHHERWDGSGYPDGLKGEENSLEAQIVAMADVYDALISPRCYKAPFSREEAARMMRDGECGMFNPELLPIFLEVSGSLTKGRGAGREGE